ncbi:hypothetical protein ABZ721_26255, partial [Streptomyces sp. NPDC006733]|uniref:hypothetical protein n=1 Tax=Streptomyces sp. NPDC006733 TaxID=3155460 RepID=UPI0033C7D2D4
LSASQANLERIIDGVLAQMPPGFGLTMAAATATALLLAGTTGPPQVPAGGRRSDDTPIMTGQRAFS